MVIIMVYCVQKYRYGKVLEVTFVRRDGNSLPYAYVAFKSVATVEKLKGMMAIPDVHNEGHNFRVEARKTFPTDSLLHNNKTKQQDATIELVSAIQSMQSVSILNKYLLHALVWSMRAQHFFSSGSPFRHCSQES